MSAKGFHHLLATLHATIAAAEATLRKEKTEHNTRAKLVAIVNALQEWPPMLTMDLEGAVCDSTWGLSPEDPPHDAEVDLDLFRRWTLKLGKSEVGGRGVFATEDIEAGTTVEVCPIIPVNPVPLGHPLYDYVYVAHDGHHEAVVLGYGFLYNSSHTPNIALERVPPDLFRYVAIRRIHRGEELLVNYGQHWWEDAARRGLHYLGSLPDTQDTQAAVVDGPQDGPPAAP